MAINIYNGEEAATRDNAVKELQVRSAYPKPSLRSFAAGAVLTCLAACAQPSVLDAPLAHPTMAGIRPAATPMPAFAQPTGGVTRPFAGPDPAAPEGDRPAPVTPGDLKPAQE
jgi:hypothetical protein